MYKNRFAATLAIIFFVCALSCKNNTLYAKSKQPIYQGCSGGMMLHAGWLGGKHNEYPYNPQGATVGIGGAMRVNLWKYLRLGGEGYVSNMPMAMTNLRHTMQNGSYIRSGWGGVLVDACWRNEKIWPYVGTGIGGGAKRSLFIAEGSQNDWNKEESAIFRKQSFFYISPFVGCDIVLTSAIHLSLKIDCMVSFHQKGLLTPIGPRLYFGLMFCH